MFTYRELPLAQRFMVISFVVVISVILLVGTIVSDQIEASIVRRTGDLTSFYLNSLLTHHLMGLKTGEGFTDEMREEITHIFEVEEFSEQVVSYKVWSPQGEVLYSSDLSQVGLIFDNDDLQRAVEQGEPITSFSTLDDDENASEHRRWNRLMETYAPLRSDETGEVMAVVEFYQTTTALEQDVLRAQMMSWTVVVAAGVIVFIALNSMVMNASRTIAHQQSALEQTISHQVALLEENRLLSERVRRAAGRTTTLNERLLQRISSDLHDGPAQDIAYSLMRIDDLAGDEETAANSGMRETGVRIRAALESALAEIRNLSAGLRLPELEGLGVESTIRLAAREYQRKTGNGVVLELGDLPLACPDPVRITLYRIVQESLTNSYLHAHGKGQKVVALLEKGELILRISDEGDGFTRAESARDGHLGIAGMRERTEILGGSFSISSSEGGTMVEVRLPLDFPEALDIEGLDI